MPSAAASWEAHGVAKSSSTASGWSSASSADTWGRAASNAALSSSAPSGERSAVLAAPSRRPGTWGRRSGTMATPPADEAEDSMSSTRGTFPAAVRNVTRTEEEEASSLRASCANGTMWPKASHGSITTCMGAAASRLPPPPAGMVVRVRSCPVLVVAKLWEAHGSGPRGEERGEVRTEERWPMEHRHGSTGGSHV
jgi:hypothetical protein